MDIVERLLICAACSGRGWIEGMDHEEQCYARGECLGCNPVQVQVPCPECRVQRDAIEAIEQLRAQVQMLGKEPVA